MAKTTRQMVINNLGMIIKYKTKNQNQNKRLSRIPLRFKVQKGEKKTTNVILIYWLMSNAVHKTP